MSSSDASVQWIRDLLRPPSFKDPEKAEMAWMLHYIVLVLVLGNIPTQIAVSLVLPTYLGRGIAITVVFVLIGVLVLYLNRRGSPIVASRLLNGLSWLLVTYSAFTAGGLGSPAISAQFVIVSTAGALLGWRWGLAAVGVCTATVTGLALAEQFGALPPPAVVHTPLTRLAFLIFYIVVLGVEWVLILKALRKSRERAEREVVERRAAEKLVRELNADLEDRVHARTSALRKVVRELEESNRQLDEATKARSRFVSNVSHELRTPLNAIIGFSSVLAEGLAGPLTDEQARQVTLVRDAGRKLHGLVNQILDLSRVETEGDRSWTDEYDGAELARHAADIVRPLAGAKDLSVSVEVPDGDIPMLGSRARTEHVLLNLLGNAVKFTERGEIRLVAYQQGRLAVFDVIDTGSGVSEKNRERIFERFYQEEPPDGGKYEGAGLGLPLAREIARTLDGDVVLADTSPSGSTFSFRLPVGE